MNVVLRYLYKIPASKQRSARIFIPKCNGKSDTSDVTGLKMKPGKEKRMDEMLNYYLKPHFRY